MIKRELSDFGPLSAAEMQIRDEIGAGELVVIGDGALPDADAGPERQVRAEFVRYLMMGGCKELPALVPETGVQVAGALITGVLALQGADCPRDLALFQCRISKIPVLLSARLGGLYLNGSALPGLIADRLEAKGSVFLRGVEATGEIRLLGATLGGDLDCDRARLTAGESGRALSADRLEAKGSVFLRGVEATGDIQLLGARVGGDFDRTGARLTAGAGGRALNLGGADINGNFFLRDGAWIDGVLDMTAADIGAITDEESAWPKSGDLILDRCRYAAFTGRDITAEARLHWLALQNPARFGKEFWPQPWVQCAKVLREMGHVSDARAVLIDMERRQRWALRYRLLGEKAYRRFFWEGFRDRLLGITVRYGRQPLVAIWWLFGFLLLGTGVFWNAAAQDAIKPNNAFVLRAPEWVACAPDYAQTSQAAPVVRFDPGRHDTQLACFRAQPEAAAYPDFTAWVYSVDTLLPIVAMEMQQFWIPDENRGVIGMTARWYLWGQIAVGWALSLLAVAGFSGLIKTDTG